MTLSIENEVDVKWDFDYELLAKEIITATLEHFNCPYETDISIFITDNEGIREINLEQREIDAPTDVLSFPMLEFDEPGNLDMLKGLETSDVFNPENLELLLGDIVLSAERIETQAEEYGHSIKREYGFLITHSMLHLLGYDHMESDEAEIMEELQRTILQKIGLNR